MRRKPFSGQHYGIRNRSAAACEGLISTSRMALIGFGMDTIYQFKELDRFYPVEAVTMVLLLAVIPYFVLRWIVEHVARWWFARSHSAASLLLR